MRPQPRLTPWPWPVRYPEWTTRANCVRISGPQKLREISVCYAKPQCVGVLCYVAAKNEYRDAPRYPVPGDSLQNVPPRPGFPSPRHTHLFLQPVVVPHDAGHDDVRPLHVERDFPRGFILERGRKAQITERIPTLLRGPRPTTDGNHSERSRRQRLFPRPEINSERGGDPSRWGKGHGKQKKTQSLRTIV